MAPILDFARAFITEALLVSAYDIGNRHLDASPELGFARLVFLDSGGYELAERSDFSDIKGSAKASDCWDEAAYARVLTSWPTGPDKPGLVAISYDDPGIPIAEQADAARAFFGRKHGIMRELLLKPESRAQAYLRIDAVLDNPDVLSGFHVIGATEKELGNSVLVCLLSSSGTPVQQPG